MLAPLSHDFERQLLEEARFYISEDSPSLYLTDHLDALKHYPLFRAFPVLPVIDQDDRLIGCVSVKEFLEWNVRLLRSIQMQDEQSDSPISSLRRNADFARTTVKDIMSSPRMVINADQPLDGVIKNLLREPLAIVPVVEDGKYLGVISFHSILKGMRRRMLQARIDPDLISSHSENYSIA